jgi:hypothetical protein
VRKIIFLEKIMICKKFSVIPLWKFAPVLLLLTGSQFALYSQTSTDGESRGLKPREYAENLQNRILARRPGPVQSNRKKAIIYAPASPDEIPVAQGTDIGLTFWRLRESKITDDKTVVEEQRILVRKKEKAVESTVKLTPERAESDTQFTDGDRLRLSIEFHTEGYIYIINREQYADGTLSEPYLVFPSQGDLGKTDRVVAGKLLFIPNESEFFELVRFIEDRPEKSAEVLTILVAPQPLKELPPLMDDQPRIVDSQQFEKWNREWGGRIWKFEQKGGAGAAITKGEKNSAVTSNLTLTKDDRLPQTIYHVAHKMGSPLMFTVPIRIRK